MIVLSPLSALKGSLLWCGARGQDCMVVWVCMAATLEAIPGLSIDVAQRVSDACVIYHDGKRVSGARKEGLVSQYTAVSMLTMMGRGLGITRKL
jgi:hypothetical protein